MGCCPLFLDPRLQLRHPSWYLCELLRTVAGGASSLAYARALLPGVGPSPAPRTAATAEPTSAGDARRAAATMGARASGESVGRARATLGARASGSEAEGGPSEALGIDGRGLGVVAVWAIVLRVPERDQPRPLLALHLKGCVRRDTSC